MRIRARVATTGEAMAFSLEQSWVWDFWIADDGERFHLFYLHAPRTLGNPDLRHRNARIGHATSLDLVSWTDHGEVLGPGPAGGFDATATWTGCVVRGPDTWYLFYTGSRFLDAVSNANVETIGVATSSDLQTWTKHPVPILSADPRWYETLGTSTWPEEAWRDPWVYRDADGERWHMLLTARATRGPDAGRGVIGHAISTDLLHWEAQPPLSNPQAGFGHLEVPQLVEVDGHRLLVFCCNAPRLANDRAGEVGGIYVAPALGPAGPFAIEQSSRLVSEALYAGRLVQRRDGTWVLLGFEMDEPARRFRGVICDPIPVHWDEGSGTLTVSDPGQRR